MKSDHHERKMFMKGSELTKEELAEMMESLRERLCEMEKAYEQLKDHPPLKTAIQKSMPWHDF
jgi:DNA-binding XRE family transcriptional regulator